MSEHPVVACYRGLDSADAVQLGALLASALGEPLVIAGAYRYEPASLTAVQPEPRDNARRASATGAAVRRARRFAGADVEIRELIVPSTDVAEGLRAVARDVDACLLAVGRDVQGRVTRSLVPQAPCPIAIAPLSVPLPPEGGLERIGIAYDGSPAARWALVAATRLAARSGAMLVIMAAASSTEQAQLWLHVAKLSLGFKVRHETLALTGDAAHALAGASGDVDLLVTGSRGRGRSLSALLGSVSAHLVTHARCPLLVVPHNVWSSERGPLGITSAAANAR